MRLRYTLALAILVGAGLSAFHFVLLLGQLRGANVLACLAGVLVGVAAADLIAGGVHWACDTWGSEKTPVVGPGLIRFFREHHEEPHGILEHDWIEVNGEACLAASVFLLLFLLPPIRGAIAGDGFAMAFVWAVASFSATSNQFHKWSHMRRPPAVVRFLQRVGLILSLNRHAPHHRAPHMGRYCISTGWLNVPLDALGFWRGLERCVSFATGARPRTNPPTPRTHGHRHTDTDKQTPTTKHRR